MWVRVWGFPHSLASAEVLYQPCALPQPPGPGEGQWEYRKNGFISEEVLARFGDLVERRGRHMSDEGNFELAFF